MREWRSLAHVKWECKYHAVIVPKYRKKMLFGQIGDGSGRLSGSHSFREEVTGVSLIKMGLTVLVPYLVSTCSSVGAIFELQAVRRRGGEG